MKRNVIFCIVCAASLVFLGSELAALPNPLNKVPSIAKFNSITVRGSAAASNGQALLADGTTGSGWGNVEGVHVASNVSGSPVANGTVLTADGLGNAAWQVSGPTGSAGIANGSVTQAKLAPGVTAIPAGNAGGDLAGTYPNPSIAPNAITADKLAAGVIPTALPPNGAAGGDLTGNYPNPTLGVNAVTTAKIADGNVTASKLAPGVIPSALPPSGPAGGGLGGTYPNPSVVLPQGLGSADSPTFGGLRVNGPVNLPPGSIPASSFSSSPIFGNGSDLDAIIPATTTLTRDMYYDNLTVNAGIVVNTGGFRIFVRGVCTVNGTIQNNGLLGGTPISGAPPGTVGGGVSGGRVGINNGNGISTINSLGGNGGNANGLNGGLTTAPAAVEGGAQVVNALPNALTCRVLSGALISGGAGGGSGTTNGVGAGSGPGGGGGGVVMLAARVISGTGFIQAIGGLGTAGSAGGGNGGGGGGGCVVIVTTSALPASITASAAGGAGGGAGTPAGMDGKVIVLY